MRACPCPFRVHRPFRNAQYRTLSTGRILAHSSFIQIFVNGRSKPRSLRLFFAFVHSSAVLISFFFLDVSRVSFFCLCVSFGSRWNEELSSISQARCYAQNTVIVILIVGQCLSQDSCWNELCVYKVWSISEPSWKCRCDRHNLYWSRHSMCLQQEVTKHPLQTFCLTKNNYQHWAMMRYT